MNEKWYKNVTLGVNTSVLRLLRLLLLLIFCFLKIQSVNATHIKAADLFAKVNPFNSTSPDAHKIIRFTLNVYAKAESLDKFPGNDCDGLGNCVELDFGDGSTSGDVRYSTRTEIGNTVFFVYYFTHTYPADEFYRVSYTDENRNSGILNLKGPTNQLAFYVEMGLFIERGLGSNQTPQMSIPPIDLAEVNRTFVHNPGAYDVDGDSISFQPFTPQVNNGIFAPDYINPNLRFVGTTQDGLSPATYNVFSVSSGIRKPGDIVWDSPSVRGLYNIAVIIEEWRIVGRSRQRISYSIRDMQIEVRDGFNNPPVIKVRTDSCISPGPNPFKSVIEVSDQDGDKITLLPYGELFESSVIGTKASLDAPTVNVNTPYRTDFTWNPSCRNVRTRPYQAFFKATDVVPVNPLTDIKSFYLTVVGPSPQNLQAETDSLTNHIRLRWNTYECASAARSMEIYRKTGCDTVRSKNCVLGRPGPDYVLIGTTSIDSLTFIDRTAKRGNVYSYSVSALFVDNFRITTSSYPSANKCVELPLVAPLITKVSFEGINKNEILVTWNKPADIDTAKVQGPFRYQLFRKKDNETQYTLLHEFPSVASITDTSYTDNFNITPSSSYTYLVELNYFSKQGVVKALSDSSEAATSVFLRTTSISRGVRLTWEAVTPWQNGINGLYHYIWRKRKEENIFIRIDSINFNQNSSRFSYDDIAVQNSELNKLCDTIQYYVTTAGSYQNLRIKPDTIYNNSFISAGTILNDVSPQSPVLNRFSYDCSNFNQNYPYRNVLTWSKINSAVPCFNIVGYNVYYSPETSDENMILLTRTDTAGQPSFSHSDLESVAGCYAVTAIDNAGNESIKSEKLCFENCALFELPNVFTPNNSGINDFFRPIPPSPRFVKSVQFSVFNRWGSKVFEKSGDININWDGSGLPDGVYFYTAKVEFITGATGNSARDLKGWIQIIR